VANQETQHWTFHHLGVIVEDLEKAVKYYKSLGVVDFPLEPEAAESENTPVVWKEIISYDEAVIKDGQPLLPITEDLTVPLIKFCAMGTVPFELIQPGNAFKEVNGDFLANNGEGISHIAYMVADGHFEKEVEKMKAKGLPVLFHGRQANGGGFTYFDTRKVGGIITELMGAS